MSPSVSILPHTWYVAIPLQAGLTKKGKMYVMVGENRVTPVAVKEFSLADLKAIPVSDLPNVHMGSGYMQVVQLYVLLSTLRMAL